MRRQGRAVIILPHNISPLVNTTRGGLYMSGNIDLRESVVRQQEAMGHTVRTPYQANYLARAVDPLRSREYCPGEIDRGNGLCAECRRECRQRKEGCYYCSTQHKLLL